MISRRENTFKKNPPSAKYYLSQNTQPKSTYYIRLYKKWRTKHSLPEDAASGWPVAKLHTH